ncbi:hypothetical protein K4K59_004185 [Colletotrichum sp. SAR11_240]|nr:hypothetical protein K4K59_004185 [Colletotrichum sp. SAR11_240]
MSLTSGASTQPFSDTPDLQRRLDEAAADRRPDDSADPAPVNSGLPVAPRHPVPVAQEGKNVDAPSASPISIAELDEALRRASLTSLPDARLIVAHHRRPKTTDPAVIPLPHTTSHRDLVGVVQRTEDVCFTLCIPFHDNPALPPSPRFIQSRLTCHIYYDPASDDCVIVNKSTTLFLLTGICPDQGRKPLHDGEARVVQPGTWRISVAYGADFAEQALVDFLILRRQFSVTIHEAPLSLASSRKRSAADAEDVRLKKRRHEGDITEILLAAAPDDDGADDDAGLKMTSTRTASRQLVHTKGTPLLDLGRGEVAVIRGPRRSHGDVSTEGSAMYDLRRLEKVADTPSASLFTGRHSGLPVDVVAKVIRYTGKTAVDLVKCARSWQQEKTVLEKLHHANIISLKAFDGRLFAMYVERLPGSLNRGDESPFAPHEARTILRDVASALSYITAQNIAHNDIKPANIAYSLERGAVLLDFGLATALNVPAMLGGTPWYIPPDLITRQSRGAPGDIWALGVTMLYVLAKVILPERYMRGWLIREVMTENSEARAKMIEWLDVVQAKQESLASSDVVENIVYKMLDPAAKSRIDASQIVAALADARP